MNRIWEHRFLNYLRRGKRRLLFFIKWVCGRRTPWCGYLNTGVYIDPCGNVFSCCNYRPEVLGNIMRERLEDIWNGNPLKHNRKLNIQGRLMCTEGCKILEYAPETPGKKRRDGNTEIPLRNLTRLFIEFSKLCNISCIMCPQKHDDKTELDWHILRDTFDYTHIELISVQGGEPLFITGAKEYIQWVAGTGKKLHVLTNGTIMTDTLAEALMSNNNDVFISLNAATPGTHAFINRGARWDRVMRTLKKLCEARGSNAKSRARIIGHMTIVPENINEIPLFIEKFGLSEFDAINFCYDSSSVPSLLKQKPEVKKRLIQEIGLALENLEDRSRVDISQLKQLKLA
jgi:radical SAM protein with 4Fe4S-binding SPASM domain